MRPKRVALAMLRQGRTACRLAGIALDRRRELGIAGIARRSIGRTGTSRGAGAGSGGPLPPRDTAFDVIYAIGYWPGEPKRYRVFNPAEALRGLGYAVHVMPFDAIDDIRCRGWQARALVLFRAEYDRLVGIADALAYARRAGMRIVYDIDDLVFDPNLADRIDGFGRMGSHQRRQFLSAMPRRRRLMQECDLITVTTTPLARAAAVLGQPSVVIPNALNAAQLRLAAGIAASPPPAGDVVRIGYFSGSPTHQRDFAECEPALLQVMRRHPTARFRLVGQLDLGPHWHEFGERVERIGLLAPDALLRSIAETDINLAPLERDNPFCEAKSELKLFEAAAVGVPTIASETAPFSAAIEHGVSGFLARDTREWYDALEFLLAWPARRREVGAAARANALARYSPAALAPQIVAGLQLAAPIQVGSPPAGRRAPSVETAK
jgi:glycosyltransferase involved in cell wall biosynthesis